MDQDIVDVLNARWLEMRDDAGTGGVRFSTGLLTGLLAAGAITEIERDGWAARFSSCPGHQGGSRVWCGFCGDLCSVCDCLKHECRCPKDIDECTAGEGPQSQGAPPIYETPPYSDDGGECPKCGFSTCCCERLQVEQQLSCLEETGREYFDGNDPMPYNRQTCIVKGNGIRVFNGNRPGGPKKPYWITPGVEVDDLLFEGTEWRPA
ncbi:MAG TPA: hypothetical protein VN519_06580 [Bryobacteraceae bacterium]|nr:hypothetical protein [Bryobacteraceae bacterium]